MNTKARRLPRYTDTASDKAAWYAITHTTNWKDALAVYDRLVSEGAQRD